METFEFSHSYAETRNNNSNSDDEVTYTRGSAYQFTYSLRGERSRVPTFIIGTGSNVDEAYKDAFEKLCTRYSRKREDYFKRNSSEYITVMKNTAKKVGQNS